MTRCARLRTLLLATGAVGALSLGAAGDANASAKAFSALAIENFQIFNSAGEQFAATDFDTLNVGNFSSAEATFSGTNTNASAVTDVPLQCLGPSCAAVGQNNFFQTGPLGSVELARGDSRLQGAIIQGIGGGSANANTVAEVQASGGDLGTSGSTVGTGTEFSFTLASADSIDFRFDATPVIEASLDTNGQQSIATTAFSITITDATGSQVFSFTPDGSLAAGEVSDPFTLNTGRTILSEGTQLFEPGTGFFQSVTPVLDADTLYRLAINHASNANASSQQAPGPVPVPEPGTLALLGAGLFGLGLLRRRHG